MVLEEEVAVMAAVAVMLEAVSLDTGAADEEAFPCLDVHQPETAEEPLE